MILLSKYKMGLLCGVNLQSGSVDYVLKNFGEILMSLIKTIGTIFFLLFFLLIEQSFLFAEDKTTHYLASVNKLFQASLEDLMNIEVVSATRIKQNITEAPSIMTVITAQQIRERGYQSVAEAVRTVPGFSMWVDNFISSISVRGFNSIQGWNQNLKIMIDGQPVSCRPANWTFIDEALIPIRCVKKIEVIKGPASALYGANAYLGAINIITFDGERFDSVEVTGIGGSLDTYGGSFVVGKKIDNIDFMAAFSAQRSNRSGLSLPDPVPKEYANMKSENDISKPKCFYGKISYKGLTMSANYQRFYKYAEFTDFSTFGDSLNCMNNWFVKGEYKKSLFRDRLDCKGSFAYGETVPDYKYDKLQLNDQFYIKKELGAQFIDFATEAFYKFAQKNSIGIGIDYTTEDQQLQNNYSVNMITGEEKLLSDHSAPQPRKDFNNLGIYAQYVFYPKPGIGLTGGLRFDSHNRYGNSTTYRIGLTNHISEKLYMKILYGTSFKSPTPRQLFDPPYSAPDAHDTEGNRNLTPQYARTFETLLGFNLTKTLHGKLGGFYTRIKDGIELRPVDTGTGYTYYQTDLKSFGFEGGLDAQFSKDLKGCMNFSYQKTRYDETDKNTDFVPQITVNAGLNYIFMDYLNINLENIFVGKRISPKKLDADKYANPEYQPDENYKIPAYLLVNLTLSTKDIRVFNNKETIFSLNCSDIFNEKHIDPGPPKDGYDIPHHGRRFLITISQIF